MKRKHSYWGVALAFAVAVGLGNAACSSKFTGCAASRSCAVPSAGSGGGEAEAGAPDQFDDSADGGQAGEGGASAASADADAGAGPVLPVDRVPPSILSVTPVNGATQLTPATDVIVVTFSEPMNAASAEAAYVPRGASGGSPRPTFSWNAPGTELSINPNLAYSAATDPAGAAEPFKFSLTTAAKDRAGNALVAAVNWQFTLLREVTQSFPYLSGGNFTNGDRWRSFAGAGDVSDNLASRGFLKYDISALPAGIVTFRSATIDTRLAGINGDPFGQFGNLLIQSILAPDPDQVGFNAPPLHDLGIFIAATGMNAVDDVVSKDVLAALADDYANRVTRAGTSTFRLLFSSAPNSNDTSDFAFVKSSQSGNQLVVKYLFP